MSETPLPEPLERFLQVPPCVPPEPGLKEATFRQTAALLRQPRRWRRRLLVAAIAASVLVAIAALYWFRPPADILLIDPDMVERQTAPPQPEKKPKPQEEKPRPVVTVTAPHPRDLEWTAFDAADDSQRVRLYFQAGDLYLANHDDYESALRCYRQALHYCDARDLNFNPDDNWLVMALKRDHRKEK